MTYNEDIKDNRGKIVMKKTNMENSKISYIGECRQFIAANLITLLKQHNLSQKDLSVITGVAESTISAIKKGNNVPTIDFLFSLKMNYDISIDDFMTKYISIADEEEVAQNNTPNPIWFSSYNKYCGTYFVYYFDTSKYKGRDFTTAQESLMFGVLRIYQEPSALNKLDYKCMSIFGIQKHEVAEKIKFELEKLYIPEAITYLQDKHDSYTYFGDFELSEKHAFMSLSHNNKDKALAIFHNVPGDKNIFAGGIGTINSVSRGRETMPTAQFMGLSREKIEFSVEEIQRKLLLNYPKFKTTDEAELLIKLFKNLYLETSTMNDGLNEEQKQLIIKSNLERLIKKSLERNVFRYAKISNRDDDDWYHSLKNSLRAQEDN